MLLQFYSPEQNKGVNVISLFVRDGPVPIVAHKDLKDKRGRLSYLKYSSQLEKYPLTERTTHC